jgi:hypothetical protein
MKAAKESRRPSESWGLVPQAYVHHDKTPAFAEVTEKR